MKGTPILKFYTKSLDFGSVNSINISTMSRPIKMGLRGREREAGKRGKKEREKGRWGRKETELGLSDPNPSFSVLLCGNQSQPCSRFSFAT